MPGMVLEYQYISLVVENCSCIECELFAITLFMKRLSNMITTCVEPVMNSIAADFGPAATLDQVSIGDLFSVRRVQAPHAAPEWARWLEESGFIEGEKGGGLDGSCFAGRRPVGGARGAIDLCAAAGRRQLVSM